MFGKRIFSIILTVALVLSCICSIALSENDLKLVDYPTKITDGMAESMTISKIMNSSQNRALITVSLMIDLVIYPDKDPALDNLGTFLTNDSFIGTKDGTLMVVVFNDSVVLHILYDPDSAGSGQYIVKEMSNATSSIVKSLMETTTDDYYLNNHSDISEVMEWVKEAVSNK